MLKPGHHCTRFSIKERMHLCMLDDAYEESTSELADVKPCRGRIANQPGRPALIPRNPDEKEI